MDRYAHLENIAVLVALVLLVWITGSGWWAVMLLFINTPRN